MLANTQSIRCAFCLTCQKICRRDSTLRIVRCCPYFKASARTALRFLPSVEQRVQIGQQVVRQRGPLLLLAARRSEHRRFRGSSHRRRGRLLRALHFRLLLPGYRRRRGSLPLPGRCFSGRFSRIRLTSHRRDGRGIRDDHRLFGARGRRLRLRRARHRRGGRPGIGSRQRNAGRDRRGLRHIGLFRLRPTRRRGRRRVQNAGRLRVRFDIGRGMRRIGVKRGKRHGTRCMRFSKRDL